MQQSFSERNFGMLSHVKKGYAVCQRAPLFFPISNNTAKRKAQGDSLFWSSSPSSATAGMTEFVQPAKMDTRVFNFTGLELTQVMPTGLRIPLENINLVPYSAPRKGAKLRHDVLSLLDLLGTDDVKGHIVIAQRFTMHARNEQDLIYLIANTTLPDHLKAQMQESGYKKVTIGDKTGVALDGMFITSIVKDDFKAYLSALDASSGVFVSREEFALCQPHPYDRSPLVVQASGYEDAIDKVALCSYRYVYHDTMPQQVYVNIAGSVVAIPAVHDTHESVGIHFTTSIPHLGPRVAFVERKFIDPKDIVETNGFYLSEKAATLQLRQNQMDRILDFTSNLTRSIGDLQKSLDRNITDVFSKSLSIFGEIVKRENDSLRTMLEEPLKDLRKEIELFKSRNEALSVTALMNKAEHERIMQERKESQEGLKLVPLGVTTVMSLLALAAKKK